MCENDAAVNAWIKALIEKGYNHGVKFGHYGKEFEYRNLSHQLGHAKGVIRELAANVPGVREWLVAHMPGEG